MFLKHWAHGKLKPFLIQRIPIAISRDRFIGHLIPKTIVFKSACICRPSSRWVATSLRTNGLGFEYGVDDLQILLAVGWAWIFHSKTKKFSCFIQTLNCPYCNKSGQHSREFDERIKIPYSNLTVVNSAGCAYWRPSGKKRESSCIYEL